MKYWKRVNLQGQTTTIESYSHDQDVVGAIEITQAEFDAYIVALPKPPPIVQRDLPSELDTLKVKVEKIAAKVGI